MFKKRGLLLVVLGLSSFFSVSVLAETRVISGFVQDENGNGVSGVQVTASDGGCSGSYYRSSFPSQNNGAFEIVLDDNTKPIPNSVFLNTNSPEGSDYYNTYKDGNKGSAYCSDAKSINVPNTGLSNVIVPINKGGRISGKVRSNNVPFENIIVFFSTGCPESNNIITVTRTDNNGDYSVAVPAGSYISYVKPSDDNLPYLTQFWDGTDVGAESCDESTLVSVTKEQVVNNVNFDLVIGGTISGNVRDSKGQPVKDSVILFSSDKCGNTYISEVKTDENGHYVKEGLPTNKNIYVNSKSKDINPYYIDKAWNSEGCQANCQRAEAIVLSGGEVKDGVNLTLDFGGIITGTVKDSLGNPIQGVIVQAYSEPQCSSKEGIWLSDDVSDSSGNFKIQSVAEGNVYLSAVVTAERVKDNKYLKTSYWDGKNGSSVCEDSVAFNVESSTTYPATNFILNALGIVKGKVIAADGFGINGLVVKAYESKCALTSVYDSYTTGDGDFVFSEVYGLNSLFIRVVDPSTNPSWIDGWFTKSGEVAFQCGAADSTKVIIKGVSENNIVLLESAKEFALNNLSKAKSISAKAVKKSRSSKLKARKAKSMGKEIQVYLNNLLNHNIRVKEVSNIDKYVKTAMKKNKFKQWRKVDNNIRKLLNKMK